MIDDHRQRVESLCLEALARDADSRAAFLDSACEGDTELRREVDSLLAGQPGAAGFLERPAWQASSTPLTPGTRLGPYEIESVIGAGGMGEVYEARDTRLGRLVAIKVLPADVASDPERRRRFEQEARAASALNNPHICILHDIGNAVPTSPQPLAPSPCLVSFLVMEHLDGQTLAARLAKSKLPLPLALDLGIQIADALVAVHKHGIVHRDLKPGNVMLVKGDGGAALQVKLLDFGLAKLRSAAESLSGAASAAPTVTAPGTTAGMVVGTVPYMAPEQIEGKPTDARTDLFAFGCVFYEMLTGTRAFAGDSSAAVMAAILEREPRPPRELEPLTPPEVDRLVRRCLAKDPDARWESAHDVADELRWIRDAEAHAPAPVAARIHYPVRRLVLIGGLLIAMTIGAGVTWRLWFNRTPSLSVANPSLSILPAENLISLGMAAPNNPTRGGSRTAFAWTPDGQALVFVGRRAGVQQLFVRRLDAAEASPLPDTDGAQVPAVSPDGTSAVFWAAGAIKTVPLWSRSPAMEIAGGLKEPPTGMTWAGDGRVYYSSASRIWRVSIGGKPEQVTKDAPNESHILPFVLPASDVLLYTVRWRASTWGDEEVVAQPLPAGDRKRLLTDAVDARYVPTGHLVFLRRGVLYGVAFDAKRLEVRGTAQALLETVSQALVSDATQNITGAGQYAVASTGTFAWIPGTDPTTQGAKRTLVLLDRQGRISRTLSEPQDYWQGFRLSPDGRYLAVTIRTLTEVGLWRYDVNRGVLTPWVTVGDLGWPVWWPPDGQRAVADWLSPAGPFVLATVFVSEPIPQTLIKEGGTPASFTPDGRRLAVLREGDIWVYRIENGQAVVETRFQTPQAEYWADFSPDGRWLAYGREITTDRREIFVRPYPGRGEELQISKGGGQCVAWNPNGRELFFISGGSVALGGNRQMMAVDFEAGRPPKIGTPRVLFDFTTRELSLAGNPLRHYEVTPDGRGFYGRHLGVPPPLLPPVTHVNLIQNWFEELKTRVPRKKVDSG